MICKSVLSSLETFSIHDFIMLLHALSTSYKTNSNSCQTECVEEEVGKRAPFKTDHVITPRGDPNLTPFCNLSEQL